MFDIVWHIFGAIMLIHAQLNSFSQGWSLNLLSFPLSGDQPSLQGAAKLRHHVLVPCTGATEVRLPGLSPSLEKEKQHVFWIWPSKQNDGVSKCKGIIGSPLNLPSFNGRRHCARIECQRMKVDVVSLFPTWFAESGMYWSWISKVNWDSDH